MTDKDFETELMKWNSFIYKAARKYFKFDDDKVDDFVGEVMLRAWTRRKAYDPAKGALSTWLGYLIWTTRRDMRLSVGREFRIPQSKLRPMYNEDGKPMAIADKQSVDVLEDVRPYIAQLPPRQRYAVEMRAAGYTFREMAAGTSRGYRSYCGDFEQGVQMLREQLAA